MFKQRQFLLNMGELEDNVRGCGVKKSRMHNFNVCMAVWNVQSRLWSLQYHFTVLCTILLIFGQGIRNKKNWPKNLNIYSKCAIYVKTWKMNIYYRTKPTEKQTNVQISHFLKEVSACARLREYYRHPQVKYFQCCKNKIRKYDLWIFQVLWF